MCSFVETMVDITTLLSLVSIEFVNPTISLAISSDVLLSGNDNSIMCALAKKKAVRHYIDLIVKVFKVLDFFCGRHK